MVNFIFRTMFYKYSVQSKELKLSRKINNIVIKIDIARAHDIIILF